MYKNYFHVMEIIGGKNGYRSIGDHLLWMDRWFSWFFYQALLLLITSSSMYLKPFIIGNLGGGGLYRLWQNNIFCNWISRTSHLYKKGSFTYNKCCELAFSCSSGHFHNWKSFQRLWAVIFLWPADFTDLH